jgi:acyl transferase domain-containing protein
VADVARLLPLERQHGLQGAHRFGCCVAAVEAFDSGAFRFTAREADVTDPQQRLLLEGATAALSACAAALGAP